MTEPQTVAQPVVPIQEEKPKKFKPKKEGFNIVVCKTTGVERY